MLLVVISGLEPHFSETIHRLLRCYFRSPFPSFTFRTDGLLCSVYIEHNQVMNPMKDAVHGASILEVIQFEVSIVPYMCWVNVQLLG